MEPQPTSHEQLQEPNPGQRLAAYANILFENVDSTTEGTPTAVTRYVDGSPNATVTIGIDPERDGYTVRYVDTTQPADRAFANCFPTDSDFSGRLSRDGNLRMLNEKGDELPMPTGFDSFGTMVLDNLRRSTEAPVGRVRQFAARRLGPMVLKGKPKL